MVDINFLDADTSISAQILEIPKNVVFTGIESFKKKLRDRMRKLFELRNQILIFSFE